MSPSPPGPVMQHPTGSEWWLRPCFIQLETEGHETFHWILVWFIGILIIAYYNPYGYDNPLYNPINQDFDDCSCCDGWMWLKTSIYVYKSLMCLAKVIPGYVVLFLQSRSPKHTSSTYSQVYLCVCVHMQKGICVYYILRIPTEFNCMLSSDSHGPRMSKNNLSTQKAQYVYSKLCPFHSGLSGWKHWHGLGQNSIEVLESKREIIGNTLDKGDKKCLKSQVATKWLDDDIVYCPAFRYFNLFPRRFLWGSCRGMLF